MNTPNSYLIVLDLKQPVEQYNSLYTYLQSFATWARPLDTAWLVQTEKSASEVTAELGVHLQTNDAVLITRFDNTDWAAKNVSAEVADLMHVIL